MGKTKDEVGYRKPPKNTQFKKGKSGNPKGRPRRTQESKSLQQMIRDLVLREVVGQLNGRPTKMTLLEAVFVRQLSEAMKGNTAATKLLFSLIDKHVPLNRSLAELMKDTPVFSWTAEDEARIKKSKLLEGVSYNDEDKD